VSTSAVELGGSHVSVARVDVARAVVRNLRRAPLDPNGTRAELLDAIRATATSVAPGATLVGVATPGPFDYERGICTIQGVGKLEALFGVDLRSQLAEVFSDADAAAIRFLNDAEAFLLGETAAGAAMGRSRVIGITLGTGLGSAFLADGRIVRDGAGVPYEGELHRLLFRGADVEETISGRALRRRFGTDAGAAQIGELADGGDPRAAALFASFGADVAEFLAPWVRAFRADCLVVGGAVARAWGHFGPPLERALEIDAVRAARIDDAALLGAALHAAADA
jgi:predicted NBD/HSP70 family sugar kinase